MALRPSYPGVSPGAGLSLLPRMDALRCLLSFPFRDLKPENILLDDYGESSRESSRGFSAAATVGSLLEQRPSPGATAGE